MRVGAIALAAAPPLVAPSTGHRSSTNKSIASGVPYFGNACRGARTGVHCLSVRCKRAPHPRLRRLAGGQKQGTINSVLPLRTAIALPPAPRYNLQQSFLQTYRLVHIILHNIK